MKKFSIFISLTLAFMWAESPLDIPKETKQTPQNNVNSVNNSIPKDFIKAPSNIESRKDSKEINNLSNASKENLDYLFEDSNTKYPVSDYIWQKERTYQDINSLFNNNKTANMVIVGYDAQGNPIYQDAQGNLYDSKGNKIQKTLKQLMEEEKARLEAERKKLQKVSKEQLKNMLIVGFDKDGKPIYQDSNGNLYDSDGNLLNKTLNQVIQESKAYEAQKLANGNKNANANNANNTKNANSKSNNKTSNKANSKSNAKSNKNAKNKADKKKELTPEEIEALFESSQKRRNPLLDEYGMSQEEWDELMNSNSDVYRGADGKLYANLYRDTLLGQRNGIQTKDEDNVRYGDSRFSNQENVDEATNEHKLYRTILAGKLIPAILLTPISSEIEGLVQAQVEQDIYANMGRAVLIPRGSKVLGFYKNDNDVGQSRLQIVWREIITPQGVNMLLTNAVANDQEGYAGAKGHLNNKYWQRYGMGISMQTLANALTFGISNMTQQPNSGVTAQYMAGNILSQSQQDINSVIKQIISKQSQIKPVITIKAGSRIYITPTAHIWFPIPKNNETMARYFNEDEQESLNDY
ncbi:hypothetical protein DCO58_11990 [Helicobacter saguini]|uniref:TrbI/VirB10 family protein n=1 Tax=Helicobacter saguini TaxID=1548018 RepID=A0A347VQD1_9HELI|nr:DNA type IV secretion system protein ComB10 [Helicobacter saguini]MWV60990.1 hypothetical protein [Helicobacter saguini]MWV68341.1 hypothetical protein [Helicobacter saguini]MWV70194.1 hypothetical protein [Helicobacter saguini]MWV72097.1 hypothetical protein [Helicobacter saguini]TLD91733.1 TrbI/VirB10 family protein [Helicobacter saguini]